VDHQPTTDLPCCSVVAFSVAAQVLDIFDNQDPMRRTPWS
jgi:hypothetical protein